MLLRDWMTINKKKISEFASEIGVKRDCIQKYMSGKRRPIDEQIIQKIIDVTGGAVTANDFYGLTLKPKRKRNGHG